MIGVSYWIHIDQDRGKNTKSHKRLKIPVVKRVCVLFWCWSLSVVWSGLWLRSGNEAYLSRTAL